jgi:DNA-binding LacI/PurR family transcriptional regulator
MVDFTIELLHEQMQEGGQPRNVVSPCQVVERDTVRPARVFSKK